MIGNNNSLLSNIKYTDEYKALLDYAIANAIPIPNVRTQRRQNGLMRNLISIGYWDETVAFWVTAGDPAAEEFATLNWKNPAAHRITKHGPWLGSYSSLGFTGDGTQSYVNFNFNPATDGGAIYTLNDARIDVQCSGFNTTSNGVAVGLRNAGGTSQIVVTINSLAIPNATRLVMHDNTNNDFAGNEISRGLYIFERVSSANKQIWRKAISSGNLARTSVSLPSGNLYGLARNSLSTATIDSYSNETLGFVGLGSVFAGKAAFQSVWINYYLAQQEPLFIQRPSVKRVIYTNSVSGWDEGSVFGEARYGNTALYGGTDETGADVGNYNVGAFAYTSEAKGTKDVGNPVFLSSSIAGVTSIFPFDNFVDGSTINWFMTVRDVEFPSTMAHDIALFTSPTSDPTNLTYVGRIISDGGSGHFNHGPKYFDNPASTTYHHLVYAFKNVSADPHRIRIKRCLKTDDISNPSNWTILHDNIVAIPYTPTASPLLGQVYPDLFWDAVGSRWILLYGRFSGEQQYDSFTLFSTESTDLSTFPVGKETIWPTGVTGDPDAQYTSLPRIDQTNKLIYYSGRIGGSAAPYTSRLVKMYTTLDGLL